MTGPLVIENKNAFTGVDKTRTVKGYNSGRIYIKI